MDPLVTPKLIEAILTKYRLNRWGIHGLAHWARVLENGRRLQANTGARLEVVELFAVFHDSQRWNDHGDWKHGQRGAELARQMRGPYFQLDDAGFELLYAACAGHTSGEGPADITVWTCWDSDRLDIGRVGSPPNPHYLFTPAAKTPEILEWGWARSCAIDVPSLIRDEWQQDLPDLQGSL